MGIIFDLYDDTIAVTNGTNNSIYICKPELKFSLDFPQREIKAISLNSGIMAVLSSNNAIYYATPAEASIKVGSDQAPPAFPNKETKFIRLNLPPAVGQILSILANHRCIFIIARNKITHISELWSYAFEMSNIHCQGKTPKLKTFSKCSYPE